MKLDLGGFCILQAERSVLLSEAQTTVSRWGARKWIRRPGVTSSSFVSKFERDVRGEPVVAYVNQLEFTCIWGKGWFGNWTAVCVPLEAEAAASVCLGEGAVGSGL